MLCAGTCPTVLKRTDLKQIYTLCMQEYNILLLVVSVGLAALAQQSVMHLSPRLHELSWLVLVRSCPKVIFQDVIVRLIREWWDLVCIVALFRCRDFEPLSECWVASVTFLRSSRTVSAHTAVEPTSWHMYTVC